MKIKKERDEEVQKRERGDAKKREGKTQDRWTEIENDRDKRMNTRKPIQPKSETQRNKDGD